MDVYVVVSGKRDVYKDAEFTVGVTTLEGEVASSGVVQHVTRFHSTGDLWVFRVAPNPNGGNTRTNIAIYADGQWESAKLVEPKKSLRKNA